MVLHSAFFTLHLEEPAKVLVNETPGGERLDLRIIWKRSYPGLLSCHSYGVWPWLLVVLLADFAISKISPNILAVTHLTFIDATGAALSVGSYERNRFQRRG